MNQNRGPEGSHSRSSGKGPYDDIAGRLRDLTEDYSQAEIARRTGTPQPSLSGYLRGRRIPAEFCARVVREFGVNSQWLLTGEGATYRADMSANVASAGTEVLGLVEAMNAASRMLLGSLVGKQQRELAKSIVKQLEEYERLRESLDDRVRPVFAQLLEDFTKLLTSKTAKRAQTIGETLKQISRLCSDDDLNAKYDSLLSHFDVERGDVDAALETRRRLFLRSLVKPIEPFEAQAFNDSNYIATLFMQFRIREANRVSRALASLHENQRERPGYWQYVFTWGLTELHLGNMRRAHELMSDAYPRLSERNRMFDRPNFLIAPLLAGTLSLSDAIDNELARVQAGSELEQRSAYQTLARIAVTLGDAESIQCVPRAIIRHLAKVDARAILPLQLETLERCDRDQNVDFDDYLKQVPIRSRLESSNPRERAFALVYATQAACRCQKQRRALALLDETQTLFDGLADDRDPWIFLKITHARSAIALIDEKTRSRRRAELRTRSIAELGELKRHGYGALPTPTIAQ